MAINIVQTSKKVEKDWWDWEIHLDGDKEDLQKIKYVEYTLHETFTDPVRRIYDVKNGFQLETSGWGTFRVYLTIKFKDGTDIEETLNISFDNERIKRLKI